MATPNAIRDKHAELEDYRPPPHRSPRLGAEERGRLRADLGQADERGPPSVPLNWLTRAKIRIAPIDDGVVADEQKTIDLYLRSGLIKQKLDRQCDCGSIVQRCDREGCGPVDSDPDPAIAT